jgi:signal transduction histidine kinase
MRLSTDALGPSLVYRQPVRIARINRPALLDAGLALALLVAGQIEAWAGLGTSLGPGSARVAALTGVLMTLPLAVRRRWPVIAALLVVLPVPLLEAFTPVRLLFFAGLLPLLVSTYTLASRAALPALAAPFGALLLIELEVPAFRLPGEIVFDWLWFGAATVLGLVVRQRSMRAERSESRVVALERERESVLRAERARIARELHDVIAHSVSVIVVQAGAAEPLVDESPEQAREALRSIRATAGDALAEMRRLLGILRAADDELRLAPQPSIAQLEPLLGQARAAGLEVGFHVTGKPRPLAPGVDLAAYRIIQEALTNTRKHGRATRAQVALCYGAAELEVEVLDDGVGAPSAASGGHGMVGMRERVALYDGTLEIGSRPGGGFGVRAVLPA